jgi:hypothetical protein
MNKINLDDEMLMAELKAIDSLSRYKFAMFGYWAGIWVHLNHISDKKRPNPFRTIVAAAKSLQSPTLKDN